MSHLDFDGSLDSLSDDEPSYHAVNDDQDVKISSFDENNGQEGRRNQVIDLSGYSPPDSYNTTNYSKIDDISILSKYHREDPLDESWTLLGLHSNKEESGDELISINISQKEDYKPHESQTNNLKKSKLNLSSFVEKLSHLLVSIEPNQANLRTRNALVQRLRKCLWKRKGRPPYELHDKQFDFKIVHSWIKDYIKSKDPGKIDENLKDKKWEDFVVIGSFATGLFTSDGDIDLTVLNPDLLKPHHPENKSKKLQKKGRVNLQKSQYDLVQNFIPRMLEIDGFVKKNGISEFADNLKVGRMSIIASAKVPIVKFRDDKSGIEVDISVGRKDGLESTEFILNFLNRDGPKRCPSYTKKLILTLKHLLKFFDLGTPFTGGLGSYALLCMVFHFLEDTGRCKLSKNNSKRDELKDLANAILDFLVFYGEEFDFQKWGLVWDVYDEGRFIKFPMPTPGRKVGKGIMQKTSSLNSEGINDINSVNNFANRDEFYIRNPQMSRVNAFQYSSPPMCILDPCRFSIEYGKSWDESRPFEPQISDVMEFNLSGKWTKIEDIKSTFLQCYMDIFTFGGGKWVENVNKPNLGKKASKSTEYNRKKERSKFRRDNVETQKSPNKRKFSDRKFPSPKKRKKK